MPRGDNLTYEARAKGGRNSRGGGRSRSTGKGISAKRSSTQQSRGRM